MTTTVHKIAAALPLALAAWACQAQTAAAGAAPASVGVSPNTAADASTKAVPRNDTATLVRTAPSAGDRAQAAANTTGERMTGAGSGATTNNNDTSAAAADRSTGGDRPVRRARKADRN